MRLNNAIYGYAAVYLDDLLIIAQDPTSITKDLCDQHPFNLNGTGPLQYHFGYDYFKTNTSTVCLGHRKYIEKMIKQ
jgi:hypothetical protein